MAILLFCGIILTFRDIPTLLSDSDGYSDSDLMKTSDILLYARRYNPKMFEFADKLANQHGWEVIDISLRATNASKHQMFYEAGVEEFLSLIKHAQFVVTNSFHGMILSYLLTNILLANNIRVIRYTKKHYRCTNCTLKL